MRVPVEHEQVAVEGRALLHSVYGDSPFVASKALFLPELARQVTGEDLPDAGALVVVPTRHLLAYHPIVDGSVADAINDLAAYAYGPPGRAGLRRLPAVPAETPADTRAWLDAFYLAVVCRQRARLDRLCRVPLELLGQDDSADE